MGFFKHIAKLGISHGVDFSAYEYYELANKHGSVRYTHPQFTIISDRPEILLLDERNQLHNENGCAIQWRDGLGCYYWHGVAIPGEWIMNKESLTPEIALTWKNIEQRRAACEILGWNAILKNLNAKIIDENPNPQIGTLLEVELPDTGKERFLRVQCGTGREFAIPVTLFEHNTALECNAATYGWKPGLPIEDFIPVHRT